jgi:hypothetical protein
LSASICRRSIASGSHDRNELDITEPQPSRSVKRLVAIRPTIKARHAAKYSRIGLYEPTPGPLENLHQSLIRLHNLSYFFFIWRILRWQAAEAIESLGEN